jgi:hypothetical protein
MTRRRARRLGSSTSFALALELAAAALAAPPAAAATDRVRVLLLDYHARVEHDVLQSFLCVEPCTEQAGCPEILRREGADYWSDDFVVFRPRLEGRARAMVERYRGSGIDLLSLSGHQASGFSGSPTGARFDTERLGADLADVNGADTFFTRPSMVLLQGCRTDVESKFTGDPREYILHVIEETEVRRSEFDRLLAAVQQIGGAQQAYRALFPNACILGYSGTQAPGGRFEIYFQVSGWLRALTTLDAAGAEPDRRFDPERARASDAAFAALNRRVEAECPGGWPCNLCQRAPEHYEPMARALAGVLRGDSRRLKSGGRAPSRAASLETALEAGSFYENTTWSCSSGPTSRSPVWPQPVDESPFARMFVELLLLPFGELAEADRARLREELVHQLGSIELREQDRRELDDWLTANTARVDDFIHGPLRAYSTFRQRDFFGFLARAGCVPCFVNVFKPDRSPLLRQNAAASLAPELGSSPYRWALDDGDPRVRRAAAEQLDRSLAPDLFDRVRRDPDPSVRAVVAGDASGSGR